MLRRLLIVGALGVVACAANPKRLPVTLDPSNPEAPQSAPPPTSSDLKTGVGEADGVQDGADPHAQHRVQEETGAVQGAEKAQSVGYTCPMHPEVTQPEPGRCPKCGMTLVPMQSAPAPAPEKKLRGGGSE